MENYYALILAGGGGTRLWPLSRRSRPKQMLQLFGEESMFRISVTRLLPMLPPDHIFVVTGASQVEDLRAETPEVPAENFIVEPFGRDSGPAAGLGLAHIACVNPNATVAILTADHYIRDEAGFRNALQAAGEIAEQGYTVTLGIHPTYPATGFGYIQCGEPLTQVKGLQAYHSQGFKEKPDEATARYFLEEGSYHWNSGMFIWKAARALAEFERQQPVIFGNLGKIQASYSTPAYTETIQQVWGDMPKISIDYAIMEHAENIAVIPVSIGWSDIGSWAAVYDEVAEDHENAKIGAGQHIAIDTTGTLVHSGRTIVTIGLEDVVIVDTDDVLLICRKDNAQDVRKAVDYLKEHALDSLL